MQENPTKFEGDFSSLWRLDVMPPIYGLSWWWYWVLILVPDPDRPSRSRQLMTLWSTKETKAVRVSGHLSLIHISEPTSQEAGAYSGVGL